jgi:chemotaxis protein MotB
VTRVKPQPVVIFKQKKRREHSGSHGGAWKVAYADFVTAMMAFFLVMWLVAQNQSVKQAVAGYFRDPGLFAHEKSTAPIAGGDLRLDPTAAPPAAVNRAREIQENKEALARAEARLREALRQLPEFGKLGKQIEITLTEEGLRIELLEAGESTFFDSGSAAPRPETHRILSVIARELGPLSNDVVLEGHTDSRPYANDASYGNWELSADRANAARRLMERAGLSPGKVRAVRGLAATRPRIENTLDPRNRRVSIVVQSLELPSLPQAEVSPASAALPALSPSSQPFAGSSSSGTSW